MAWATRTQSKPMNRALHQQLGIDINRRIPERILQSIIATPIGGVVRVARGPVLVDTKLKYRANFALNAGQAQSGGLY